jgi:hypothetical protein
MYLYACNLLSLVSYPISLGVHLLLTGLHRICLKYSKMLKIKSVCVNDVSVCDNVYLTLLLDKPMQNKINEAYFTL